MCVMRDGGNRIKRSILSKRGARMQMKLTLIPLNKFQEQELIDYSTAKVDSIICSSELMSLGTLKRSIVRHWLMPPPNRK